MFGYYFKIGLLPMTVGEQATISGLLAPWAGSFRFICGYLNYLLSICKTFNKI
jgi:hypothetical protein